APLAQHLDPRVRHAHAVADPQARGRRLTDGYPASVIEADADLIDDLRSSFVLFDLVAGIGAARRADHRGDGASRPAAYWTSQAGADETADDQPRAAGTLLLDDFVDGFDRAYSRRGRSLHDLVGLGTATGQKNNRGEGGDPHCRRNEALHC